MMIWKTFRNGNHENTIIVITFILLHCLVYRLSVCEKALAEYLETKRLAFPRFYFVSSADLLDILSKGNQPVEVCGQSTSCIPFLFSYI